MKYWVYIVILICCFSCKNSNANHIETSIDVVAEIVAPKHYIVPKTSSELIIDGLANEESWSQTEFTDHFIDIEGIKEPKFSTKVKMLWDEEFLYVYSEMEEPHVWGYLRQRDTVIFYNNDFEVFIDPFDSGLSYGEIELNALNTVWDLYLDKPYRVGGNADFGWNLDAMKTAVSIKGTINDPSDIDTGWTVEMAIPLQPFVDMKQEGKNKPKDGEQWRINFSRVNWDHDIINGKYYRKKANDEFQKEYNWVWSNQKVINMHEPEKWGYLQFSENISTEGIEFIVDPDLLIKQSAYALFRKTRYGDLKDALDKEEGFSQKFLVKFSKERNAKAGFTKTKGGFEYKIESPVTKKTYIIDQEGKLTTL